MNKLHPSKPCQQCTGKIVRGRDWKAFERAKYCSRECYWKSLKGKPSPKKGTGRKKNCIVCNEVFGSGCEGSHRDSKQWEKAKFCSSNCQGKYLKGKKRPQYILDKMHAGQRSEYPELQGKNHWNWKGGITDNNRLLRNTPKYNNWRKAVYRRDRWTCQDCSEKQKHPIAHHIKSWKDYPSLRYTVSNGVTLCRKCHKIRHKEIGTSTRFTKNGYYI